MEEICPLLLNGLPLGFVEEYKYLGVVLCAGKFLSFSPVSTVRSFYRAANAILYSHVKPDNAVLMKPLYTNCVPIITYPIIPEPIQRLYGFSDISLLPFPNYV